MFNANSELASKSVTTAARLREGRKFETWLLIEKCPWVSNATCQAPHLLTAT